MGETYSHNDAYFWQAYKECRTVLLAYSRDERQYIYFDNSLELEEPVQPVPCWSGATQRMAGDFVLLAFLATLKPAAQANAAEECWNYTKIRPESSTLRAFLM